MGKLIYFYYQIELFYRFVELITLKNRYHCSNVLFRQDFAAYCLSNRIRGLNFNNPWWYKAKEKSFEEMIIFFVPVISLLFFGLFSLFLKKKVLATPKHAHIDPRSHVIITTKRWFFRKCVKSTLLLFVVNGNIFVNWNPSWTKSGMVE